MTGGKSNSSSSNSRSRSQNNNKIIAVTIIRILTVAVEATSGYNIKILTQLKQNELKFQTAKLGY